MEEEGHTNDQRQKERLRGKLRTGLVSVQEHYEALLKTTLRASRRAYIKGKLEIFKRIVDEIEKRKKDIEKDFRRHFLSNVYSDIPESNTSLTKERGSPIIWKNRLLVRTIHQIALRLLKE